MYILHKEGMQVINILSRILSFYSTHIFVAPNNTFNVENEINVFLSTLST